MPKVSPFDLVLFGGSGDLAMRKLLPALYHRHRDGDFPAHGRIISLGRHALGRDEYVKAVHETCTKFVTAEHFSQDLFDTFAARLDYLCLDANKEADFKALADYLQKSTAEVRGFYLATAPDLFTLICGNLAKVGLVA